MIRVRALAAGALVLALGGIAWPLRDGAARGFRGIAPIVTPRSELPAGVQRVAEIRPVDRSLVVRAVHAIARAWNGGSLDRLLDEQFTDRARLLDTLNEVVPRDASLRVLAVRGVSTLNQYERVNPRTGAAERISTVSAVVDAQIEFNDPRQGYQRLRGTNEFVLRVRESAG